MTPEVAAVTADASRTLTLHGSYFRWYAARIDVDDSRERAARPVVDAVRFWSRGAPFAGSALRCGPGALAEKAPREARENQDSSNFIHHVGCHCNLPFSSVPLGSTQVVRDARTEKQSSAAS